MPACVSNARSTQPRMRSPLVERAARLQAATRGFTIIAGHAQERSSRRANCASDSHISRSRGPFLQSLEWRRHPRGKLRVLTRETFFSCMLACRTNARSTQPRMRSPLVERAARHQAMTRGFTIFAGHAQERSSCRANCASDSHIKQVQRPILAKPGVAVPPTWQTSGVNQGNLFPACLRVGQTLAAHGRGCAHLW